VDDGGAAVTGYQVTAYRSGQAVTGVAAAAGATSVVVPQLTNGAPHTFTVAASNAVGRGASSDHSAAVTPRATPGAPTLAAPNLGNGAVRVKWAPPSVQGASPVTGYTVRAYRGSTLLRTTTTAASARDLLVTGLANGTAHTFTVDAKNASGAGPVATVTATPRTVPGAPRIGAPTPGAGSALVRWAAPLSNGGAPVTGYTVRAYRGTSLVKTVTAAGSATSVTVTGLANGSSHTFQVAAANAAGSGSSSARSTAVVPRTKPAAPRITSVNAGRSAATVYWAAPSNGGAALSTYLVRAYRGTTLVKSVRVKATTKGLAVSGLAAGVTHRLTVAAVNVAGEGAPSASAYVVPKR
jgi:hypothetical protein